MEGHIPRYYLALFSEQSWQEFLAHGGTVYGTTKNNESRAQKLQAGDILLCYISKWSVFAGVLCVTGPTRFDETPLYDQGVFPVRLDVEIVNVVDLDDGLPVAVLRDRLTIFKGLKNPNLWAGFFIKPFNRFPEEDGEMIVQALPNWIASGMTQAASDNCREKVRAAVQAIIKETGRSEFTINEVRDFFHRQGIKGCSDTTIASTISNRSGTGTTAYPAATSMDYERIGKGRYRLI